MTDEIPISKAWRTQVVAILKSGDKRRIYATRDCLRRWEAAFPDAFEYELRNILCSALSDDTLVGIQIHDMEEGYDTWKFFFSYRTRKLYGKVGLHPSCLMIKIYSAHPSNKGDFL